MEMYAWESGHGFPIFDDEFGLPVDFQWLWDIIAFGGGEELVSHYVEYINDSAELYAQAHAEDDHDSAPTGRTPRGSDTPPSDSPIEQPQHQHFGRFRVGTKADGPVSVGGADFDNMDDCVAFLETLTDIETKLLSKNIIQLKGDSSTGLRIVPGPNAKFLPERTPQANKEAVQIHASPADHQLRHVQVHQAELQPVQIHTITANPPSRNMIIRQEDQIQQPIVFLQENPVKQGKKPVQEQKPGFKRVGSPPTRTVAAELDPFRFYGRESTTHGVHDQAVNDHRLFDERKSLFDKKAYAKAAAAALREREQEDFKKDKTAVYEAEDQKLQDILARYSAHQKQSSSSPSAPGVNPSNKSTLAHKSTPAPKTAHSAAAEARRKIFGAEPSAHRSLSFHEPTRLAMRPRVTGISPSYATGVDETAYRMCGTSVHQAHAEDSPEDSSRPAPGSWRDV